MTSGAARFQDGRLPPGLLAVMGLQSRPPNYPISLKQDEVERCFGQSPMLAIRH